MKCCAMTRWPELLTGINSVAPCTNPITTVCNISIGVIIRFRLIMRYARYMYMSELIIDFIEHMEVERGRSAKLPKTTAVISNALLNLPEIY